MENETMTLAGLRRKAGLSQTQVAAAMGISQARVSRMEAQYPDVRFPALRDYLHVIGAKVIFDGWDFDRIDSMQVTVDASRAIAMENRRNDPTRSSGMIGRRSAEEPAQTAAR